ncbi:RNA polymerase sigma factor [Metabacillus malikii]|uniref:RNA polymerase sigma-70 factor (ECF subfamily) n=1 Tax=Metabacillus malikii TaxID=1504265 RepID=A0ABT9ZLU5_9BACI|nr:RNA polymerase sigma factor [Metabacillus malikii]MDQ0232488.1 RNA polymerase sigma-70 factor (ECF subfamily) [Metabacillus malikii]
MDKESIADIIEKHRSKIIKVTKNIIKNPSLVDDIVQDASIKIYTYFQKHEYEIPKNIEAWVTILTKNTAYDHLRKIKRQQEIIQNSGESTHNHEFTTDTPEKQLLSKEQIHQINEVFSLLDKETREILILRNQGYSYNEISKLKKLSLGKVKTKIFRGRKKMMDHLMEKGVL